MPGFYQLASRNLQKRVHAINDCYIEVHLVSVSLSLNDMDLSGRQNHFSQRWLLSLTVSIIFNVGHACGLWEDEIAGLKGENIDGQNYPLRISRKGGRYLHVPIPGESLNRVNRSTQYLFTQIASSMSGFRHATQDMAKELAIEMSGVYRLRTNFAQS